MVRSNRSTSSNQEHSGQISQQPQNANLQQRISGQSRNIGRGRPRNTGTSSYSIRELKNQWFGNKLSSDLITYLCQKGQFTIKAKSGPIPNSNVGTSKEERKRIKKFRQQFRGELQSNIQRTLKYLHYKRDRKFLLLGDNKSSQDLFDDNQFQQSDAMNNVLKLLDTAFIPSFKLIVLKLMENTNQTDFDKIHNIINQLKENKEQHKMLFDLQLIQTSTEKDLKTLKEMVTILQYQQEEDQRTALTYCSLQKTVPLIDFKQNNGQNFIESIFIESKWLENFITGIMNIIKQQSR